MITKSIIYILPHPLDRVIKHDVNHSDVTYEPGNELFLNGQWFKISHTVKRGYGQELIIYLDHKNAPRRLGDGPEVFNHIILKNLEK